MCPSRRDGGFGGRPGGRRNAGLPVDLDIEATQCAAGQRTPRQLRRGGLDHRLEPRRERRAKIRRVVHRGRIEAVQARLLERGELGLDRVVLDEVQGAKPLDGPAQAGDRTLAEGSPDRRCASTAWQASASWARKPARLCSSAAATRASTSAR